MPTGLVVRDLANPLRSRSGCAEELLGSSFESVGGGVVGMPGVDGGGRCARAMLSRKSCARHGSENSPGVDRWEKGDLPAIVDRRWELAGVR